MGEVANKHCGTIGIVELTGVLDRTVSNSPAPDTAPAD